MKEEKRIIIKGEFKSKNITFAEKFVVIVALLILGFPLWSTAYNAVMSNSTWGIFIGCFIFALFLFAIWIFFTKGFSFGIYKIELYEDEILLKKSLFSTNKLRYDDIESCYCIGHRLFIKNKEYHKAYEFSYVENSDEIVEFVLEKIGNVDKNYNFQYGTQGKNYAFTNSSHNEKNNFQNETKGKDYAFLNSIADNNLNLQFEKEKNEYLSKKKKLYINIAVGVIILVLLIASTIIYHLVLKEQNTNNEMTVSPIFGVAVTFLPIISVVCLHSIKISKKNYRKAKSYYVRKLSGSYINDDLAEGSVRVIKLTEGGRIVIYYDRFKGTYKCSHETFILESKTWKILKASNEYKSMEEIDNYLREYRMNFL